MSILLSIADSLIMSGIDQFAAEKWRDKKRDKQLQEDYNTWLEREKGQQYYDALDRALSNSNIIQEFITYTCCPDRRFSIHDRIEDLFRYVSYIICDILCEPLLQLIISEYKQGRVDDELIKELILWLRRLV